MKLWWLMGLIVGLCACNGPEKDAEFDLCGCQAWDQGQRNMALSQKCIDACLEKFGPNLEGMEEWFLEHCNPLDPKPDTREQMAKANSLVARSLVSQSKTAGWASMH